MTQFDRDNRKYAEQLAEQGFSRTRKTNKEIAREAREAAEALPTTQVGRVMVASGEFSVGHKFNDGTTITGFGRAWSMDSDDDRCYQVIGRPDAGTGSFSVCYAYLSK